jgi:hypothetical protein
LSLSTIQARLSDVYDLEGLADVQHFLCDRAIVREAGHDPERGELLLVQESADGVDVGLYIAPEALDVLGVWGPFPPPSPRDERFSGWLRAACLATEGVSHFLYLAFRERHGQPVSQLELELQAEVDKYVAGLWAWQGFSRRLRGELFHRVRFLDPIDSAAGERYRLAHRLAAAYAAHVERAFLERRDWRALRAELCRFYRLGGVAKVQRAARVARWRGA